jgi:hypothetical protein
MDRAAPRWRRRDGGGSEFAEAARRLPRRASGPERDGEGKIAVLPIGGKRFNDEVARRIGWRDWFLTIFAGAVVAGLGLALLVGSTSSPDIDEVEAAANLADGVHWLASVTVGACATIAALSLTTLSVLDRVERQGLSARFLFHIRATVIGAFAAIAFGLGGLVVSLLPATREVRVPLVLAPVPLALEVLAALMAGAFASTLVSLFTTIGDIFRNLPREIVEEILTDDPATDAFDPGPVPRERTGRAAHVVRSD